MSKGALLYRWVAQLFTWGSVVWCVNVSELADVSSDSVYTCHPACNVPQLVKYANMPAIMKRDHPHLARAVVKPAGTKTMLFWSSSDERKIAHAFCRAGIRSSLSAMR